MRIRALYVASFISAFAAIGILSTPAHAADIGVGLTETSVNGGPDMLTVTGVAGATVAGTTDNWTITLPGITLSNNDLPQVWVEATGDTGFNNLGIVTSNTLSLMSEAPEGTTNDNFCGTGSPLPLGVSCFIGSDAAGNAYFASVNEVHTTSTVPEPTSIILLGTCVLCGLSGRKLMRRKRV